MSEQAEVDKRFIEGIDLFNRREFYDCHEILEDVWNDQVEPEKQLTQGIIQIAVAYYHVLRANRVGAKKLLLRGLPRVKPFLPEYKLLLLDDFYKSVELDLAEISSDPEQLNLLIPTLKWSEPQ